MLTIAADPKHLGARIGMTAVLHTWGSALTHHPHVHMIVPGGGLSLDGERFIPCRRRFFLPVRVLSRLFRRLCARKACRRLRARALLILEGGLAKLASPPPSPPCSNRCAGRTGSSTPSGPSPVLHNAHLTYSKQNRALAEQTPLMTAP